MSDTSDGSGAGEKVPTRSRRRFLTGVGIGGLTVAAAVFGRSTAANATYRYGCCDLELRANKSYSACTTGHYYTWGCAVGGCQVCSCCEQQTWAGDHYITIGSAYQCGNIC